MEQHETLWKKAKQWAMFQSLLVSFVISSFILSVTLFKVKLEIPWPIWPMLFMGVCLIKLIRITWQIVNMKN